MKLTPAKRRTMQYLADREFVSAWPLEVSNRSVRNALEAAGYMETFGHDPGRFGFVRYRITEAGRKALTA